jgi:dUTP pyrophosphatase
MNAIHNSLIGRYERYMLLRIKIISTDDEIINAYWLAAEKHNRKVADNIHHIDAGFDLYVPEPVVIPSPCLIKINFQIQCAAQIMTHQGKQFNTGFYLYPRSSLSNTKLRLANSVGIVDAGYRGNLIGAFDPISDCIIDKNVRLVQICAPGLVPILVEIVSDLGEETARGTGGFGSSGM